MPASGGNEMSVVGIDHASFPTGRDDRASASGSVGRRWRSGAARVLGAGRPFEIEHSRARALFGRSTAKPGCADVCFEWAGSIESAVALIRNAGAEIVEGPVPRSGGRSGDAMHVLNASSVYTRDPDGNLLEFLTYRP
jgi:catechol 2,3-dioxygenase-like lactoylglutathione lyase family enzyme